MSAWNFDLSQAPKGSFTETTVGPEGKERVVKRYHAPRIIAAGKCGVVTVSKWLHDSERREMFTKEAPPLAWMPWPTHPQAGEGL